MIGAGELNDVWAFQVRTQDDNGDLQGPFDPHSEFRLPAKVIWLKGSEAVMQDRLTGIQPVIITVPDCHNARQITPAWRGVDARRLGERFTYTFEVQDLFANVTGVSPASTAGYLDILATIGKAHG